MNTFAKKKMFIPVILMFALLVGCSSQKQLRTDISDKLQTVKAGKFDNGKMWTFDWPPMEYFKNTYGFNPDKEWFEKARLSALRLPGCTGSFVSEDGLVMTNHHCARGAIDKVNKEGENLPDTGFYASTLADERKIPDYYIDQLVLIEDVTKEVQAAFEKGTTDAEKLSSRSAKIKEIEERYKKEKGLECSVVTFFNGGKYSLYGYKRYNDVRLVFAPETQMGFFGGDYDNFTYPRYDLDCSFYRIYDDEGKPLNTKYFFKYKKEGAQENDFVMVLGNPGSTRRLLTFSQLEFLRDFQYPATVKTLDKMVDVYAKYIEKHPEKKLEYQSRLFGYANSQKAFKGMLGGLLDPTLMAKKYDFERNFKKAISENSNLNSKYGNLWDDIEKLEAKKSELFNELTGISVRSGRGATGYLAMAADIVEFAKQMLLPVDQRNPKFKNETAESYSKRFYPAELNEEIEKEMLEFQLGFRQGLLNGKNAALNELLGGFDPKTAVDKILKTTAFTEKQKTLDLFKLTPSEILASNDPLIKFVSKNYDAAFELRQKYNEANEKESAKVQELGIALFEVYGTTIPPDATFTLRMADGVVKGYEYNGTIAPAYTTYYGLYDRHYSFKGMKDFDLPKKWKNPSTDFKMETPFNFVMTSDIIGGNSGSAVVNKNLEAVGLIFDGNIESLPSDIIYQDSNFRAVAVQVPAILEALQNIYNARRLYNELIDGKMTK